MICKICGENHGRHGGHFNKHLKNKHNIDNYLDYIIKVDYDGIRPLCGCGCGEQTTYHQNNFKEFVHGHNTQHQYSELYKNRPNEGVKELYKSGKNCSQISKILKLPLTYVYKVIKDDNLTRTMSEAKRIYELDQTVFDVIDNEEKAYWLGFLYADGYNHETRGTIVLTLCNQDIDTLEKFRDFLKTNKPIGRNDNNSSKVVVESKHMSKRLNELGVKQAKTHILEFPKLERELVRHFIRGYFDGDGSISYGKILNYNIGASITSTKMFLSKIVEEIPDVRFWFNKRHKERDNNIYSISTGSASNIIKLYHYLYNESTIFMDRKKNKFDDWFDWHFNNIKTPHNKTIELKNKLLYNI